MKWTLSLERIQKHVSYYEQGYFSAEEVFSVFVECADTNRLAAYLAILPPELLAQLPLWLDKKPTTDAEWAQFYMPQLDGDDESARRRLENYRTSVEAFRSFLSKNRPG
jgi:hypothetical protein